MGLPFAIPRGFSAGVVPWQRLVAVRRSVLWACAGQAKSDKQLLCPIGFLLSLSMPPSQILSDIDDPWWQPWVLIVLVLVRLLVCPRQLVKRWLRRKCEVHCRWVHSGWWARIFGVRLEVRPRGIVWCVRHGRGLRYVWLSGICALAFHFHTVLGLGRVAFRFLFSVFVIVRVVSPMLHWTSSARKPMARAAVERASGTTKGSPCRVTLSGAFFFRCRLTYI